MSQHADILTHAISKGISRGDNAAVIVNDINELLDILEYDESFTNLKTVREHTYSHAKWMMTQKDGLYGISHAKLDAFITELWSYNQWLSA